MEFKIVRIDELSGSKAKIYSIQMEGDDMTLLDHFFEDNKEHYEELVAIEEMLETMGTVTGCRSHFFKQYEGAPGDGVVALHYNRLRLYCLRYDNTCIFVGSGGYKSPPIHAYQEDPILNAQAGQMRKIAACINKAIIDRDLTVKLNGALKISEYIDLEI